MEFINAEIVAITNTYKKGTSFKLPAATAWKRRLNMNNLMKAREVIDSAIQDEMKIYFDEEHSDETEDGNRIIKKEFRKEAMEKQSEILSQTTDVEIKKVKITDLGDEALSDEDMDTLIFMIEDEK